MARDYYEILGVGKDADDAKIKNAYRQLAKKYHPDVNPGDKSAEAKFKEAAEAYAILSDPEKRSLYDRGGHAAVNGGGGFNPSDMGDMSDIFGDIFGGGGFGDIFGSMFGGGSRQKTSRGPQRGADVKTRIKISFEEAVFGCSKDIELSLKDVCEKCGGSGAKPGTSTVTCEKCGGKGQVIFTQQSVFGMVRNVQACPECRGTGKIIKDKCSGCGGSGIVPGKKKFTVDIPAGINNGEGIRLAASGEPGKNGGPKGDIIVEILVAPHPFINRENYNLFSTEKIPFTTAALGGKVTLRSIEGPFEYSITPGTQSGTKVKFSGKGVPQLRGGGRSRGDHYVTFVVDVPSKLNGEQKRALKDFEKTMENTK